MKPAKCNHFDCCLLCGKYESGHWGHINEQTEKALRHGAQILVGERVN